MGADLDRPCGEIWQGWPARWCPAEWPERWRSAGWLARWCPVAGALVPGGLIDRLTGALAGISAVGGMAGALALVPNGLVDGMAGALAGMSVIGAWCPAGWPALGDRRQVRRGGARRFGLTGGP